MLAFLLAGIMIFMSLCSCFRTTLLEFKVRHMGVYTMFVPWWLTAYYLVHSACWSGDNSELELDR